MTVYLDIIFLENFILNCIILYAVSLVIKEKVSYIKLMIASLIGASYGMIYYLINFHFIISKNFYYLIYFLF